MNQSIRTNWGNKVDGNQEDLLCRSRKKAG